MLANLRPYKLLLAHPWLLTALKVIILAITLIFAFFVKTGVVSADPGWGVVGG
jgi:hypothetical protein